MHALRRLGGIDLLPVRLEAHVQANSRSFGSIAVRPPPAPRGRRVGVMGGSFNPPHAGHVLAAKEALLRLGLDELWWVVTPGNPLKQNNRLPSLADRISAIEQLTNSHPRMRVTGFEAALRSPFTAVTLRFLKRRYPGVKFVWVMGADNLATFDRWQNWRGIAATMPMAVVNRPGYRLKALSSPAAKALAKARLPQSHASRLAMRDPPAWVFLTNRLAHHSSTTLRQSLEDKT